MHLTLEEEQEAIVTKDVFVPPLCEVLMLLSSFRSSLHGRYERNENEIFYTRSKWELKPFLKSLGSR